MKTFGWISAAGLVLAWAALTARTPSGAESAVGRVRVPRPAREAGPVAVGRGAEEASPPRSAPPASGAEPEPLLGGDGEEERFWNGVAGALGGSDAAGRREELLRGTAAYLEAAPEAWRAFEEAIRRESGRVRFAWTVREEAWSTLCANVGTDAELREQVEREVQGRYEREKQAALERLGALLGGDGRGLRLRGRLEEWFDAVR